MLNKQEIQKLEKRALTVLRKYIKKNDRVIAAVSGGPDSIFLLEMLKKLSAEPGVPAKIVVAHLNHSLRKESDKDEAFVKKITEKAAANSSNLIFHSKKVSIKKLSQKHKTGLEETGRKQRYDFFSELAKKYHARYIVTAHHADDNLETVLLNFARGASLEGLAGIQEVEHSQERKEPMIPQIPGLPRPSLLRPLLQFSKQQILDYLKFNKIPYHKDKSNKNLQFKRNFIRHKIIPQFKKINPHITETISRNLTNLREINEFLNKTADDWLEKNSKTAKKAKNRKVQIKINAKTFRKQPDALQKIILLQAYKKLIGNTKNIQAVSIGEVLKMIRTNVGNKSKHLGKISIYLKNNILRLSSF